MADPKKYASPVHLSPQTGESHSRTPSLNTPRRKRSIVRDFFGKRRSNSPIPTVVNNMSTAITLSPNSALGAIKASRPSPSLSISTTKDGIPVGNASYSTNNVSNPALAAATANPNTLSLESSFSFTTATTSAKERGHDLTGSSSSVTKGAMALNPRSDIFPKNNVGRVNIDIVAPKVGRDFESTAQLAVCAGLLKKIGNDASSSSVSSSATSIANDPSFSSLSVSQQAWILEMEKSPGEKQHLDRLMSRMVNQFVSSTLKGSETIREIILLGYVLNRELYKTLLDCFLKRLDGSVLLDVNVLLGLVQLIQEAPKDCLTADDLNRTLGCFRRCFDSSQIGKDELAHLVLATTLILILLVPCQITGLDRVKEHEPLLEILLEMRKNDDPLVRYQADYACQSLLSVPDDETPRQEFVRHFLGLSNGLLKMSGIARLEFNGIAEGLPDAIRGTRGLFDLLRNQFGAGDEAPWFKAVREAEVYAQRGDFSHFKDVVCDPRHFQDSKFLWGITQLLGEIAADPSWDVASREHAVEFLTELFRNRINSKKGNDKDILRWIQTVFGHLSRLSVMDSSDGADAVLTNLHAPIKAKAQALFDSLSQNNVKEFKYIHPLRISLPLPESSLLLQDVNHHPDLDHAIYKHQHKRQNEYKAQQAIYIPPMSKVSLVATDDNPVELHARTHDFLEGAAQVMLILGDSGAGKSMFNRHLENKLWEEYKPKESRIPLFINLPEIDRPQQDMIDKQLRIYRFSEPHIKELKFRRRLILICDGYDEAQLDDNLHTSNFLDNTEEQNVKMIICCRSTFVGQNHRDLFSPQTRDRYQATKPDQYTEAVIIPFSDDQIKDYVSRFVRDSEVHKPADDGPIWSTRDYMDRLKSIPKLLELVKNPFLLSLSVSVLPRIVGGGVDLATVKVTRLTLYDSFIDHWSETSRLRLRRTTLLGELKTTFDLLVNDGFTESVIDFSKKIAAAIYHQQSGVPVVEYRPIRDRATWKHRFFGSAPETTLLLESSPLSRVHDQYRFMHQSLLEYFYSRYVFETREGNNVESQGLEGISNHPLSKRHLVKESSILQFLAEYVQSNPDFKDRLDQIIELSKTDTHASQAAANAITILVRAGIRFHGADLKGIRIPGADLSYGQFDSVHLQGADLRNTTLRSIWLRQADLSNAQMEGVEFGEWPYLQECDQVSCSIYSPDGKACAAGLFNGTLNVYNTSAWSKTCSLRGHTKRVTSVVYSPSGHQIASGSEDETVRLWDTQTGAAGPVLTGHTSDVSSVAYSPYGHQIASCSNDKTVRLWDAQTGAASHVLNGHTSWVTSVVYSPSGHQIASGSEDETVRLWDTQTGVAGPVLTGHANWVTSVVYSPSGHQIASGSGDSTVRLWDAQTGAAGPVLTGHSGPVSSVVYSVSGYQIASSSLDETVRLWDAQTGAAGTVLTGHTNWVTSVVYSPSGHQIASGSWDNTVRLWDAQTGAPGPVLTGHSHSIASVVYSPSGHQIASGSWGKTVRLWDAHTGAAGPVSTGHTSWVTSVVYSPSGNQIASGSWDKTVRLWDAHTGAAGPVLTGHANWVTSLAYSPNGHQIASGSEDETVRLWDAQTGAAGPVLTGHTHFVSSVVYSPSGHQIASGSEDNVVRLWDAETGAAHLVFSDHIHNVTSVVYSPSGHQIASGSEDKTVRLWDTQTGAAGPVLTGHTSDVLSVAYSPSGHQIASGSKDKTVRLWNAQTGAAGPVLTDHIHSVTTVFYSESGHQIVSFSWDETVRLWDAHSAQCVAVINSLQESVACIAWREDHNGTYYVTGSYDSSVRAWNVITDDDQYQVRLHWNTAQNGLFLSKSSIQNVQGLSRTNMRLLQQRGAVSGQDLPMLH